jgi:hypothetical protein
MMASKVDSLGFRGMRNNNFSSWWGWGGRKLLENKISRKGAKNAKKAGKTASITGAWVELPTSVERRDR